MAARGLHRRDGGLRAVLGQRGEDAAGVQPAGPVAAEHRVPVVLVRLQLRGGRIRAVGNAQRRAHAEATLGEVQAHARVAADAVVVPPDDLAGVHATGLDQLLGQCTQLVARQRGEHAAAVAEGAAQPARHVVLATAFPHVELAGVAHAAFARVQAQHHFAQRQRIPALLVGCRHYELLGAHRALHPSRPRSMPSARRR
ncbi:hypothetical protein D3C72_1745020 [compost metagenome]